METKECDTMKIHILKETTPEERLLIDNTVKKFYQQGFDNGSLWRMKNESDIRKVHR